VKAREAKLTVDDEAGIDCYVCDFVVESKSRLNVEMNVRKDLVEHVSVVDRKSVEKMIPNESELVRNSVEDWKVVDFESIENLWMLYE
jgi:hypothetical protein